ncbi:MarR family winged helix-turn-helix transcriptional regulator [Pseudonocardia sp. GCM10023141]|uniref:MarR family winged helix-turn-helix transcriptional regulator n=1 Tax=Pseudonocardia sp. GCM10023141 TaxID=3252653 RepID=UPI0036070EAB
MSEPRWLDEREAQIWLTYRTLAAELNTTLEQRLGGLSGPEYAVLVTLSESAEGVVRARELGAAVGWDRSRLSHQVSRMEKRGLVVREECERDARGSMVRITPAGRTAIEAGAPQHVEAVRRYFFDAFASDVERDMFAGVMERIVAGLPGDPSS